MRRSAVVVMIAGAVAAGAAVSGAWGQGLDFGYIGSLGGRGQEVMTVSCVAPGGVVYGVNNYYPSNSPYFRRAWVWTQGAGTEALANTPSSGTSSGAYGVSADGSVVVGVLGINPGQQGVNPVVFRRVHGGADEVLPLAAGMTYPNVTGVSDDGQVVVGTVNGYGGGGRPVRWIGTAVAEMLPVYGAGPNAHAVGVNGDGGVIVGWSGFGYPFDQVAVRWVDGQVESLGVPAGYVRTWATGVSADGSVIVGTAEGMGLISAAFRWTEAEGFTLLPNHSSPYAMASSVSADGRFIAGRAGADSVVWKDGEVYRVQADLLSAGQVVAPYSHLAGTVVISRDGRTIAASERVSEAPGNAEYHAWVVGLPEWFVASGACVADFTVDGAVDGDDVIAFFGGWDAGDVVADVTGDGGVDGDDVILFFELWDSGC